MGTQNVWRIVLQFMGGGNSETHWWHYILFSINWLSFGKNTSGVQNRCFPCVLNLLRPCQLTNNYLCMPHIGLVSMAQACWSLSVYSLTGIQPNTSSRELGKCRKRGKAKGVRMCLTDTRTINSSSTNCAPTVHQSYKGWLHLPTI